MRDPRRGSRSTPVTTSPRPSGPMSSPRCGRLLQGVGATSMRTPPGSRNRRRRGRCWRHSLNELSATSTPAVLVLDDYHLIDSPDIDEGLNLPPGAPTAERPPGDRHTRRPRPSPGWPARAWRAHRGPRGLSPVHGRRGRRLPERSHGPAPHAGGHRALEGRTEGWIVALQLAALSMQGRDDAARVAPQASRATTATSSTIWSRKSCNANPIPSAGSSCEPPSSLG